MKREADINRVKRAMEHIQAAIVNIESIKEVNRTDDDDAVLKKSKSEIAQIWRTLRRITQ